MEIKSPAGASREALAGLHSATRAAIEAEDSHPPAKAPPQDGLHNRDFMSAIIPQEPGWIHNPLAPRLSK